MYSSRTMFRIDPTSDVGRNLSPTPQLHEHFDTNMELPLSETQRCPGRYRKRAARISKYILMAEKRTYTSWPEPNPAVTPFRA